MNRGYVSLLIQLIRTHRLHERGKPEAKERCTNLLRAAEQGMMSEGLARASLPEVNAAIEALKDFPNPLHRTPSTEELYANGQPDLCFGALTDDPDVPVGLRFRDRPRATLIAGNAGSGKTTLILGIIEQLIDLP